MGVKIKLTGQVHCYVLETISGEKEETVFRTALSLFHQDKTLHSLEVDQGAVLTVLDAEVNGRILWQQWYSSVREADNQGMRALTNAQEWEKLPTAQQQRLLRKTRVTRDGMNLNIGFTSKQVKVKGYTVSQTVEKTIV